MSSSGNITSRYSDPTEIYCPKCGWKGKAMDCTHTYKPVSPDDVEPVDLCPVCGSEELEPC